MTPLQHAALGRVPMTEAEVEAIYGDHRPRVEAHPTHKIVRSLCESHERLRADLAGAETLLEEANKANSVAEAMLSKMTDLQAECDRLRDALKPFAHQARIIDENNKTGEFPAVADFHLFRLGSSYAAVCAGDCRRAREAIKGTKPAIHSTWADIAANAIWNEWNQWEEEAGRLAQQEQNTDAGSAHMIACITNKLRWIYANHSKE